MMLSPSLIFRRKKEINQRKHPKGHTKAQVTSAQGFDCQAANPHLQPSAFVSLLPPSQARPCSPEQYIWVIYSALESSAPRQHLDLCEGCSAFLAPALQPGLAARH